MSDINNLMFLLVFYMEVIDAGTIKYGFNVMYYIQAYWNKKCEIAHDPWIQFDARNIMCNLWWMQILCQFFTIM